jgi:hypothetical protein
MASMLEKLYHNPSITMEQYSFMSQNLPAWLSENKCLLSYADSPDDATHLSMDGLKIRIPWHLHDDFLANMARSISKGTPLYIIEKRTPFFKFHLDLDFVQPVEVTIEFVQEVVRLFQATMMHYLQDAPHQDAASSASAATAPAAPAATALRALILATESKTVKGSDGTSACIKTGFHIIFPQLIVKTEEALLLRAGCVVAYRKKYGDRKEPSNSIEDLLDECVLTSNGLRMMGCRKMAKCRGVCKGNARVPCAENHLSGSKRMVDEERIYWVVAALDAKGRLASEELAHLKRDMFYAVRECSIRTRAEAGSPPVQPPAGAPMPVTAYRNARTVQRRDEHRDMRYDGGEWREGAQLPQKYSVEVTRGLPLFDKLQQVVQTRINPVYKDVEVAKIVCDADRKSYIIKLRTTCAGGNFCMNVGRDHTSAQIYFFVDVKGISQRCYSKKSGANCGRFRSEPQPLPQEVAEALFPATALQNKQDKLKGASDNTMELIRVHLDLKHQSAPPPEPFDAPAPAARPAQPLLQQQQQEGAKHPILHDLSIKDTDKLSFRELIKRQRDAQEAAVASAKELNAANNFTSFERNNKRARKAK